jgi:hypothetical protein
MTYSYLLEKGIIVPPKVKQNKTSAFEGAYVKDPQIGMHNWVASFDLNSLYPHLMMEFNISPETLISPENYTSDMHQVIRNDISVDKLLNKQIDTSNLKDVTLTPNGQFFRTDIQGFLPRMMEEMYEDRKKFKKLMLKAQQDYENEKDDNHKYEIEKRYISEDRNKQIYKIVINYFGDNCKDSNLSLKSDFEELFELIKKNDYRVSYDILTDICYARDTYSLRDISADDKEDKEVKVCSECGCTKHFKVNDKDEDNKDECYKCHKKLWTEFYYNNDTDTEINGLVCHTCCDKHNDYILLKK